MTDEEMKQSLRTYLTGIRKKVREVNELRFKHDTHPERPEPLDIEALHQLREIWDSCKALIFDVLKVNIIPFHQLLSNKDLLGHSPSKGHGIPLGKDPLRISLRRLKQKAKEQKEKTDGHNPCEARP
jgi:hypothetical protein